MPVFSLAERWMWMKGRTGAAVNSSWALMVHRIVVFVPTAFPPRVTSQWERWWTPRSAPSQRWRSTSRRCCEDTRLPPSVMKRSSKQLSPGPCSAAYCSYLWGGGGMGTVRHYDSVYGGCMRQPRSICLSVFNCTGYLYDHRGHQTQRAAVQQSFSRSEFSFALHLHWRYVWMHM